MMSLTFPDAFKREHADLFENLVKSSDRLTTPFDLHETFLHLLDIKKSQSKLRPSRGGFTVETVGHASLKLAHMNVVSGISLLHEIPLDRTCASAHIALHWCTCLRYENRPKTDPAVVKSAQIVVEHINRSPPLTFDSSSVSVHLTIICFLTD